MAHARSSDERHLLELLCLLPELEDKRFWNHILKLSGDGDWLDFNTQVREAVSAGRCCWVLSEVVLGLFGPSEYRAELARLIGSKQHTSGAFSDVDRRGVGEQWIQNAVSTAWRVWFSYARPQDKDPLEALKCKWNLD
ncbi:hypothetical protein [Streptomyces violaceusniger]|uniref:Uncharacterized protein n=1 Tax=Streptomyces violaceusniger (strain Tu 4113) TaxID=653045 RepID=G2PH43_STRV4|nr:hypothetical protein [Streptomyces violaceusniger]AEM88617.1 hypothetical protein Strvi_9353 [Streptomyces violaceusniger Tu 4113]